MISFQEASRSFGKSGTLHLACGLRIMYSIPFLNPRCLRNSVKVFQTSSARKPAEGSQHISVLFILWVLIGAWHGAGFNYLFGVGILQFLYILLGEICNPLFIKAKKLLHINDKKLYWHIFQSIRCTLLMMFAWVFFNAKSFQAALQIIKSILVFPRFGQIISVFDSGVVDGPKRTMIYLFLCIIIIFIIDLLHEKGKSVRRLVSKRRYPVRLAFYLLLVFTIIIFGAYGNQYISSNFIYTGF